MRRAVLNHVPIALVEQYEMANRLEPFTSGSAGYVRLARRCRYIVLSGDDTASKVDDLRPGYWVGRYWKGSSRNASDDQRPRLSNNELTGKGGGYNADMKTNINEDELKLMAYLHENALGYDDSYQFEPSKVTTDLGLDDTKFRRMISYIAGFGLIGVESERIDTYQESSSIIMGICLTASGENFMRELENAPSVGRKLTVGAITELWGAGKGVIVTTAAQLLAEFAKHYHR